ncbi:Monocopper oxidase-like protein SKS2 [Bienertia sinuspersici]
MNRPSRLDTSLINATYKSFMEIILLNLTASAALPNPQASFKYGQIIVTHVYVLVSRPAERIDGKWHATLNGLSYFTPSTPLTLAQLYKL